MTHEEMIADRVRYVRDVVVNDNCASDRCNDDLGLAAQLADPRVRVAIELVLRYIEAKPEHWRGEVEP